MEDYIKIYAIMPSSIYMTKQLTPTDKLIAERITALCKNKGYAWITNKSLADMYGVREDTVSKAIKKLEKHGFIKCNYNWQSETKSKRIVYLTDDIWNKYRDSSSIKTQENMDYINNHNNKYNKKNNSKYNLSYLSNKISYDPDGVMVWNGKRCESTEISNEEREELENLLAPFKDENE